MRKTTAPALLLVAACGGHPAPRSWGPLAVTRLGAADAYGPGIVSVSPSEVRFELAQPAHVIVLRIEQDGTIDRIFPQRDDEPTQQQVGWHYMEAPEPEVGAPPRILEPVLRSPDDLVRAGRRAPPPASPIVDSMAPTYWLVVASDVPTSASQVQSLLRSARREYRSVKVELEALPRTLVVGRATTWAAYYARAEAEQR